MNAIQINNLEKKYGNHIALNSITLEVEKGSVFGLLGPNGAGKSTLIRILCKILQYDRGEILIEGNSLADVDINRLGYMPEERGLYSDCSIEFQLLYFAKLKGLTLEEAQHNLDYWLHRFDIRSWRKRYINELSKGMQQKVQFICSLIHNPQILFLDEPFSGLDPSNVEFFQQEILNLKKNGCTVVLSTHDMDSVEKLCDSAAFILGSNIVASSSVEEIKNIYGKQGDFEIIFRGKKQAFIDVLHPDFEIKTIEKREAVYISSIELQSGNTWTLDYKSNLLAPLLSVCDIISFKEKSPSLNDVFLKIVDNKND